MANRVALFRAALQVLALLLLGGCGLWPFGVAAALMLGGGAEEKESGLEGLPMYDGPHAILFSDAFDQGLTSWILAGGVPPFQVHGGRGGMSLNPGGSAGEYGEAITAKTFDLDRGLGVYFYARIAQLGVPQVEAFGGLKSRIAADARPTLGAGIQLFGVSSQRRFLVNETLEYWDDRLDTQWHAYGIEIGEDGSVQFFVDNVLVFQSQARIDPRADNRPVTVGGRSAGGLVLIDNVLVAGSDPVQDVLLAEGFGGTLAAWQTGSTGGTAAPVIDPFLEGAPAPSLNPGGGVAGVGEAVTSATFDFTGGMAVAADLYMPAVSTAHLSTWFGLQTTLGFSGNRNLAAGVLQDAFPGVDKIRYFVNDVMVHEEDLVPGWHSFVVAIRPDRHVEFSCDGALVHCSAALVDLLYNFRPVKVGGKSWGGPARIDNVSVVRPALPVTPAWALLSPNGSTPFPARLVVSALDAASSRILGFGGGSASAPPGNGTWSLPLPDADAWTWLAPAGPLPPAREGHACVFDAARNRLVAFGGRGAGAALLQDTWALDFANGPDGLWTDLAPAAAPSARWRHTLNLDAANRRAILFGGAGPGLSRLNDIYVLDLSSAAVWSAISPVNSPPSQRAGHSCVTDSAHRRLILFGGENSGGSLSDVWSLDLSQEGAEAWSILAPAGPAQPAARSGHTAVYDPHHRRMVLFGGTDGAGTRLNDAWFLDLADGGSGRWVAVSPFGSPPTGREGSAGCYDATSKRLLLFGGEDVTLTSLNDLFELRFP